MTIKIAPSLVAIIFALHAASPAIAADADADLWAAASANIEVSEKVVLWLDGQARWTDDVHNLGQVVIRPGVGAKLGPNTTAYLGYAFSHTNPLGPSETNEHRVWQQLSFRIAGDGKRLTVTGRARLEQRWVQGAPDMGWRARQQIRVTAPITGHLRGVAWSEAFIALDTTTWGQRHGLDRWRNFIGITVPLTTEISVEPGYLNQRVFRRGADNVRHIGSMTIAAKF